MLTFLTIYSIKVSLHSLFSHPNRAEPLDCPFETSKLKIKITCPGHYNLSKPESGAQAEGSRNQRSNRDLRTAPSREQHRLYEVNTIAVAIPPVISKRLSNVIIGFVYILHTTYHRPKSTQMSILGDVFEHFQEEASFCPYVQNCERHGCVVDQSKYTLHSPCDEEYIIPTGLLTLLHDSSLSYYSNRF